MSKTEDAGKRGAAMVAPPEPHLDELSLTTNNESNAGPIKGKQAAISTNKDSNSGSKEDDNEDGGMSGDKGLIVVKGRDGVPETDGVGKAGCSADIKANAAGPSTGQQSNNGSDDDKDEEDDGLGNSDLSAIQDGDGWSETNGFGNAVRVADDDSIAVDEEDGPTDNELDGTSEKASVLSDESDSGESSI